MGPKGVAQLAEKYGVLFESQRVGAQWVLECWAPDGMRWKATGTHFLALVGDGYYTRPDWAETKRDLQEHIAYGFEKCDDPECDVCEG